MKAPRNKKQIDAIGLTKSVEVSDNKFNKETKSDVNYYKCNCKRFEQKNDGRFYCRDCGAVEYTAF
jgi:hypothetical protein